MVFWKPYNATRESNLNSLYFYQNQIHPIDSEDHIFASRAFLYGESVFSTFSVEDHQVVALERHLERLRRNLDYVYQLLSEEVRARAWNELEEGFKKVRAYG